MMGASTLWPIVEEESMRFGQWGFVLVAVLSQAACVTQGKYDQKAMEAQNYANTLKDELEREKALEAKVKDLEAQHAELSGKASALESQLTNASAQRRNLEEQNAQLAAMNEELSKNTKKLAQAKEEL